MKTSVRIAFGSIVAAVMATTTAQAGSFEPEPRQEATETQRRSSEPIEDRSGYLFSRNPGTAAGELRTRRPVDIRRDPWNWPDDPDAPPYFAQCPINASYFVLTHAGTPIRHFRKRPDGSFVEISHAEYFRVCGFRLVAEELRLSTSVVQADVNTNRPR